MNAGLMLVCIITLMNQIPLQFVIFEAHFAHIPPSDESSRLSLDLRMVHYL